VVEGAPLLRAYTLTRIEGSNPFLSASKTTKRHSKCIECIGFIALFCTALHALELDLLHILLHISLHKVR
jgi:hypothetical protein